jgi:hypothetical protein
MPPEPERNIAVFRLHALLYTPEELLAAYRRHLRVTAL